jgi:hypothetical protein
MIVIAGTDTPTTKTFTVRLQKSGGDVQLFCKASGDAYENYLITLKESGGKLKAVAATGVNTESYHTNLNKTSNTFLVE